MNLKIEQLWTIEDVANYCRVKASIVKYWVHNREIPFVKLGKQLRFNPEDIRNWVLNQDKYWAKFRRELKRVE